MRHIAKAKYVAPFAAVALALLLGGAARAQTAQEIVAATDRVVRMVNGVVTEDTQKPILGQQPPFQPRLAAV